MERFEARVSPRRNALFLLGAIAFVAIGFFLMLHAGNGPGGARDPAEVGVGIAAVLLFGAFGIVIARQFFRREPVMEIDASGILWRRWSDQKIPWSAITRVEVKRMQRQRYLSLWLTEPARFPSSHLLGKLAGANRAMGFGDLALNVPGTDRSFDELVAAVDRFAPGLRIGD